MIEVQECNGFNSIGRGGHRYIDITNKPMPTIQSNHTIYVKITPTDTMKPDPNKPPYRVPLMSEISALPWNGYNVVSTFSGAGGSCLGYRMAGFKVLWANEFVPAAQDTYRRNHPGSILDTRDIRTVQPQEILDAVELEKGEIDLLDGSPPCASFSTAGKRETDWGKVKNYSDVKQRTDDLFFEYIRILDGLQPKVFVAENVSGLVKGTAKGYFKMILQGMKDCGYTVTAKLLDAQWLGVPQQRQRIIFIGVRNDLGLAPVHPKPLTYQYSVRDALPWIQQMQTGSYGAEWRGTGEPSGAVLSSDGTRDHRRNVIAPVEKETDISRYAIGDEWDRIGEDGHSKKYLQLTRPGRNGVVNTVTAEGGNTSLAGVTHPTEKRKFSIAELRRICAFPDDFILTGSYAQQWERLGRSVPPVMMAAIASEIKTGILDKCQ